MHLAFPDIPFPLLLRKDMNAVVLDVQRQLSTLHASYSSNIGVQVHNICPPVAPLDDSSGVIVIIVTSTLISRIVQLCRSSQKQCYIPIIHEPSDVFLVPNQGRFALCFYDESLTIWGVSSNEVISFASEANRCFTDILSSSENFIHDDPLDSLNLEDAIPLKPDVFWLDEFEGRERPILSPFVLEGQSEQEDPDSIFAQIFMYPPTPMSQMNLLSPISPFSSEDSLSPSSVLSIPNEVPIQDTVSPRDVCPDLGRVEIDEPMDIEFYSSPTGFFDLPISDVPLHDGGLQSRSDHIFVPSSSPHVLSSSTSLSPQSSTSSLLENTHLLVPTRKRRGSHSLSYSPSCSSKMRTLSIRGATVEN